MDLENLIAMISQSGELSQIGRQFGLDDRQMASAVASLAPVVAAGMRRNMNDPRGVVALVDALQRGSHAQYVDNAAAPAYDAMRDDGNAILGHVFGSKDVSRGVAMQAANSSGISSSILKMLLPIIASMVMGSLAKKMGGGSSAPAPQGGGGLGDILGDILGGGRQSAPAPQPRSSGGGGGLGDILGDILGGGRQPAPAPQAPQGGGGLDDLLRDILGGPRQQGKYHTEQPDLNYDENAVRRGRGRLDDILGGGTSSGQAADDLLNSVERRIRGM